VTPIADSNITFLMCEHVHQEGETGKFTLIGVSTSRRTAVKSRTAASKDRTDSTRYIPLALFFSFTDGEGAIETKVSVYRPDGTLLTDGDVQRVEKSRHSAANIYMGGGMFPVSQFGEYKAVLQINGTDYSRTFVISDGESS
tara:strand:- start:847 stop:1272 length:426 start_codon:yes stop_codon:yes gene_type:complete